MSRFNCCFVYETRLGQRRRSGFLLVFLLVVAVSVCGYAQLPDSKTPGGPASPQVISGDVITADGSGMVFVSTPQYLCSGTLLTNEWVITAQHCAVDIANPGNNTLTMGKQSTTGVFAVNHPSLDFTLIKLQTPMTMGTSNKGFRQPLYQSTGVSLEGQTLTCRGYGCNAYTKGDPDIEHCTGVDGTLRQALLSVKSGGTDGYNFTVTKNAKGQILAPGDSGAGCFATVGSSLALAGVNHAGDMDQTYLGIPENWRDWANAYIDGTPIPLPSHWFVYTSSHPTFLTPPLPNNYTDQYSWSPCPDGRVYSFSASFNLEDGKDFISLQAGPRAISLTGKGRTVCTGSGPITVTIKTDAVNQSSGLTAMPISCGYTGPSSEPPITNVSPAVAGVGNSVYFFARTSDGRIMYQTAEIGQAGLCWMEVEGNGRTDVAPAAAAVGTHVFVAIKTLDGHVAINQADLGQPFGQWFPSDIVTDAAPAVAGVGNEVYFFAKTTDGRIMFNRAPLGAGGVGWKEVDGNGRTATSPAAGAVGNHVFVAIKASDGQVSINQADLAQPFGQWFPSKIVTDVAPAVAGVGNEVYFFSKTTDGRIMFNRAPLGAGGVGWKEVDGNGRTTTSPAAGAVGNHLFVAIKTSEGHLAINQADLGQPFGQWF
jgi:hypothetical protein